MDNKLARLSRKLEPGMNSTQTFEAIIAAMKLDGRYSTFIDQGRQLEGVSEFKGRCVVWVGKLEPVDQLRYSLNSATICKI